jgi:hypothetical protein
MVFTETKITTQFKNWLMQGLLLLFFSASSIVASEQNNAVDIDAMPLMTRDGFVTPKDWTFIVYIAADNDLRSFAARNIKQMAQIGSNQFINIVVQLDIRITGNKKITRRYYIENNKIFHVNADDPLSQKMDSGDPRTLVSCCNWAITNYPARNYALILWNHGTGIIDPETGRIINPAELFTFNPSINKLELDRTVGFLEFINDKEKEEKGADDPKGVCWDDSTGNYLTNQKLESALKEITKDLLGGKKLDIIGFDACLMSMLEIANIAKSYAHLMVGSQEVELGAGWDYEKVLRPFGTKSLDSASFAKHIVDMYAETYTKITNDFTQSALNLDIIDKLEKNVNQVAALLLDCLKIQQNNSVKNAIQASRSKLLCTHFDEPSYLDLHHLYSNLLGNIKYFAFTNEIAGAQLRAQLTQALEQGKALIKETVIASRAGKNLSLAQGLSIYFPERRIHSSYRKTSFASTNKWITFMTQYLLL